MTRTPSRTRARTLAGVIAGSAFVGGLDDAIETMVEQGREHRA